MNKNLNGPLLVQYSPDHTEGRTKYPIANHQFVEIITTTQDLCLHKLSSEHIPNTVQEALNYPKWTQVITEEIAALQKNNTWKLMPLLEGKKAVGCSGCSPLNTREMEQ